MLPDEEINAWSATITLFVGAVITAALIFAIATSYDPYFAPETTITTKITNIEHIENSDMISYITTEERYHIRVQGIVAPWELEEDKTLTLGVRRGLFEDWLIWVNEPPNYVKPTQQPTYARVPAGG
jgi:hypothetical protein